MDGKQVSLVPVIDDGKVISENLMPGLDLGRNEAPLSYYFLSDKAIFSGKELTLDRFENDEAIWRSSDNAFYTVSVIERDEKAEYSLTKVGKERSGQPAVLSRLSHSRPSSEPAGKVASGDAWSDKSLFDETFSNDLQTMAKILDIQRLYTDVPLLKKVDQNAIEKKYPSGSSYHADIMTVSAQFELGMKAIRKPLSIKRFGSLLTGIEIDANGNISSSLASVIGVDRSSSKEIAKNRDDLDESLRKGENAKALKIVEELILSYPNDFELLLDKAQILLKLERWNDASVLADKCQSSLDAAMTRVRESSWFSEIQKENNLDRLSMIGYVKVYLQGINQEAKEVISEAKVSRKQR